MSRGNQPCGFIAAILKSWTRPSAYPLLRRLESQGLLASAWREEDKRPKRYYRLTSEGRRIFDRLTSEWQSITATLETIFKETGHGSR